MPGRPRRVIGRLPVPVLGQGTCEGESHVSPLLLVPQATSWAQGALKPVLALLFLALVPRPFAVYPSHSRPAAYAVIPPHACCRARFRKSPRASSGGYTGRGSGLRIAGLISFRSFYSALDSRKAKVSRLSSRGGPDFICLAVRESLGLDPPWFRRLGVESEAPRPPSPQARLLALHPFRQSVCPLRTIRVPSSQKTPPALDVLLGLRFDVGNLFLFPVFCSSCCMQLARAS